MTLTNCTCFLLTMFSEIPQMKILLFAVFLIVYLVALLANLLLIVLRLIDHRLHTPMYFFLSHLSFIDIIFTSSIAPKLLSSLLSADTSISSLGCATQMFIVLAMGASECFLLAIMAFDRHLAICQPLRYHVLMSQRICSLLVASCWICSFVNSLFQTVFTFLNSFCKSRQIRHFFCEIQPLLRLSCDDTTTHELVLFVAAVIVGVCSFLLTFLSYSHIISTILKIRSTEAKTKVFSTCSSHLLVVTIFYGTILSIYMRPIAIDTPERDRVVSVLYTMGIPMCNPLIYSMRNKDVKEVVRKTILKTIQFITAHTDLVPKICIKTTK